MTKRRMEDGAYIVRPRTLVIGAVVFLIASVAVGATFLAILRGMA